ncbi:hypothetical protein BTA51_01360 [Hahella sp. CCB-MM4]|nr:hypothetical protein BTA51_01360 [Hahella sp. CCB-MM4]
MTNLLSNAFDHILFSIVTASMLRRFGGAQLTKSNKLECIVIGAVKLIHFIFQDFLQRNKNSTLIRQYSLHNLKDDFL